MGTNCHVVAIFAFSTSTSPSSGSAAQDPWYAADYAALTADIPGGAIADPQSSGSSIVAAFGPQTFAVWLDAVGAARIAAGLHGAVCVFPDVVVLVAVSGTCGCGCC